MKAVILAGGLGTRLSEETGSRPKPMVEIGGRPILWHIMKHYIHFGITDFVVCMGYMGHMIETYFSQADSSCPEATSIALVNTGMETQTGGRLRRIAHLLDDEEFCMTYGDGVADLDITRLIAFHRSEGCLASVTAVRPPARFGRLSLSGTRVSGFQEKPRGDGDWINGGFFVLSPRVLNYIEGDNTPWEKNPMQHLAESGQLAAFCHDGFWQPMDTLRDKNHLEELWATGAAPWKLWD